MNDTSLNQVPAGRDERQQSQGALRQEDMQSQSEAKSSQPSIGAQLVAQREARGWTIEQVASQLNLAVRQVQALEQDNFDALPGLASVRGFIRAYAKLLKMDATPLVATLAAEVVPPAIEPLHSRRPLTAPFSDVKHLPSNGAKTPMSMSVVLALGALVVAVGAFAAYRFGWIQLPTLQQASTDNAVASSSGSASATVPAPEAANTTPVETKDAASATVDATQGNQAVAPVAQSAANAPAAAAGVTPSPAPVQVQTSAEKSAVPNGKDALVLKMREASWIEIRRVGEAKPGTSNVLLSRLERAGTTETYEVTEPVVVTIGNAGGVDATLRGEPIDLKPNAKSNVARLNLK